MSEFFDWNYERGTWYETEDLPDGKIAIFTKQDVEPSLEYAKLQRNSGINDKVGEFAHYCHVPAHVDLALLQRGINMMNPNQTKEFVHAIETDYPYCKTTNLKMWRPRANKG